MLVIIQLADGRLACMEFGDPVEPVVSYEARLRQIIADYDRRRDQLWDIPVPVSAPLLATMLEEAGDDPQRLVPVIRALGWLSREEVLETIRGHLEHPDDRVKLAAIKALGQIQNPVSAPDIEPFLWHRDREFRLTAVAAVSKLWDYRAGVRTLESAALADPSLRPAVELGQEFIRAVATRNVNRSVDIAIATDEYEDLVLGISVTRDRLMDILRDGEASLIIRLRSARVLGLACQKLAVSPLYRVMNDESEPVELRVECIIAIGRAKGRAATDRLLELLDHPERRLRAATIDALGLIGQPRVAGPLLAHWGDYNGAFRPRIRRAASRLCGVDQTILLKAFVDQPAGFATEGFWIIDDELGLHDGYQAHLIENQLSNLLPEARRQAILLVAHFGSRADADKLAVLARGDADESIRRLASEAYENLMRRILGPDRR